MKRAIVTAAVGAIGALGAAGLMSAAPASAETGVATCSPAILCSVTPSLETFFDSINPATNLNTFFHGTDTESCDASGCTTTNDGLGIVDQPTTFVNSVGDFLSGPRLPS